MPSYFVHGLLGPEDALPPESDTVRTACDEAWAASRRPRSARETVLRARQRIRDPRDLPAYEEETGAFADMVREFGEAAAECERAAAAHAASLEMTEEEFEAVWAAALAELRRERDEAEAEYSAGAYELARLERLRARAHLGVSPTPVDREAAGSVEAVAASVEDIAAVWGDAARAWNTATEKYEAAKAERAAPGGAPR